MPSATRPCDLERTPTLTWVIVRQTFTPALTQVLRVPATARCWGVCFGSSGSSEKSSRFMAPGSLRGCNAGLGGRKPITPDKENRRRAQGQDLCCDRSKHYVCERFVTMRSEDKQIEPAKRRQLGDVLGGAWPVRSACPRIAWSRSARKRSAW